MTGKPDVIAGEKFALPVTWVWGIKLRVFAFSSVAASHDSLRHWAPEWEAHFRIRSASRK